MSFNRAAIDAIFDKVVSHALSLGYFEQVNQHEPKAKPGSGLSAAVWVGEIKPVRTSGLAATSGLLNLQVRVYISFIQQPFDMIDPTALEAVTALMDAYSGDFDFGEAGGVREVDLLGAYGPGLSAKAGYVEISKQVFRIMTITVPVVVNDMFTQAG